VSKFNEFIFKLFKIDVDKYPTISSLAFAIFRSNFIDENLIPQISGQVAKDVRQAYTGGAVDMYIPRPPKGVTLFGYDVNSLYPFTMYRFDMPVGKPVLFEGDIRAVDPDAYGFFYCKIESPDNLKHPIFQTHVKVNDVTTTLAPLGEWTDMLFSVEMDNAIKFGYKFEILWGYTFERKNIFKKYVDTLYQLRLEYPKTNPLNLIAKLLMNSLYGRFGMEDSFPTIEILSKKEANKFIDESYNDEISNIIELKNKIMIIYRSLQADINTMLDGNKESHNVSIGIAAAITAYARIHMSQFKNNNEF
jgi:DNA polymerase type B, organellar and viral